MILHHLNLGTFCPVAVGRLVCHGLLIEGPQGLLLVDTGFGTQDIASPKRRLGAFVRHAGAAFDIAETAIEQVRALGYQPTDVRDIVVTHLDLDHAGGIADFPWANVHCFQPEYDVANSARRGLRHRMRYRPIQWAHRPKWKCYTSGVGESWFGFELAQALEWSGPQVRLVPLAGHTVGHCGIAVDTGDQWILHAGDAYFFRDEIAERVRCPMVLSVFQRIVAQNNGLRLENRKRLRELALSKQARVFCAHDPVEFQRWKEGDELCKPL